MAYQNIPVANAIELVQSIASFAAANGWTVHRDEGGTGYHTCTLSSGGAYITIHSEEDSIYLNGHRGFDDALPWNEQPDQYYVTGYGGTQTEVKFRIDPIMSVHLFGGASPVPHIYAAVEKEPGYFRHIIIGHVEKFGVALGGLFWDISDSGWDRRYTYDIQNLRYPLVYKTSARIKERKGGLDCQDLSGNSQWASFCSNDVYSPCGMWASEMNRHISLSSIDFNGRTPLQTPLIHIITDGVHVPYGVPPNIRYISLELFESGDEITIGSDTWKVFPVIRRGPSVGDQNRSLEPSEEFSENYGLAYLKS